MNRMKSFLAASLVVFALVGVATTMLGPMLPVMAAQWKLTDTQSGLLFVAQFCGGFLGAIASTSLIQRISIHLTMRAGLLIMAAGVACVPYYSAWTAAGGILLYGIGIGFATPSISVAVCEALPGHRARALNLLNLFWALGAILAPGLISRLALRSTLGLRGTLFIISAALVTAAFVIPPLRVTIGRSRSTARFNTHDLRLIIVTGLLIFIYVGVENGVAGWLPTFAQRLQGFSPERGSLLQGTFWAALLTGRLASALFIRHGREHLFLSASMVTVTLGTAALLLGRGGSWLYLPVILIGAGCAPVFPTTIAVLSQHLSSGTSEKLGWMFAAGGLGGAVLPFCIGVLSSATASLRIGMCILFLAELGMMAAHATMRRSCLDAALPAPVD